MIQKLKLLLIPLCMMVGILIYLLIAGEQESKEVRESVVRFHVVANSDSEEDQQLKLRLRDGLFSSIESLFADCADREEALAKAEENKGHLAEEGERILKELGSDQPINVTVGERFFPTKTYGALSFPAGSYQAVSVTIGEGAGKNFWCVLYPALCISPAVSDEEHAQKMAVAVGEDSMDLLQMEGGISKVKFRLVEWFEILKKKFMNS